MNNKINLLSSTRKQGKFVSKIIHFVGGYKKTIHDVETDTIEEGEFVKFRCKDDRMILINKQNVLMVEVFKGDLDD